MYYCDECKCIFKVPDIYIERHGLLSPPFEKVYACPKCKSTAIEKRKVV